MSGWGAYGGTTKPNPFAEGDSKVENSSSLQGGQHGAWDIPLRDTDDQTPSNPGLTAPKPAAKPARNGGGWLSNLGSSKKPSGANGMQFASKEEELAWREEDLRRREQALAKAQGTAKNWPPCWHLVHHDINADIPSWNRRMMRVAYFAWLICALAFLMNWLTVMALMFTKKGKIGVKDFFICSLGTAIGLPMSFLGWYRGLYFAAQTDGATFSYIKTLIWMIIHIAWSVLVGLALPTVSDYNAGLFVMFDVLDAGNYGLGVMCILSVCLWAFSALLVFWSMGNAVAAMRAGSRPREEFESKNIGNIQLPA